MQRICFCKTVSLFNHVLQPSQALALFYQTLLFSLKNLSLIKWISNNVDIPVGLQLLMIDINGNVTIDNDLFSKELLNRKCHVEQQKETTSILNWVSRIVLRLATDCSISSKFDRSPEFETLNEFLKQFHSTSTNDRSTLFDDNDDEDISRRAIHRALIKCINYATTNSFDTLNTNLNSTEMQDLENNSIAVYNQQIIQILCSDTLELEIELTRESQQSSFEIPSQISTNDNKLTNYYSIWANLWRDVTVEYLQFNDKKCLRKVPIDKFNNEPCQWSLKENDFCLHDRLMFEIKQRRRPEKSLTTGSIRKRIRPIKALIESDCSSDDEYRDQYGRKRVAVVECLLESSSSASPDDQNENKKVFNETNTKSMKKINYSTIENLVLEHISMEKLLQVCLFSSLSFVCVCFSFVPIH
jgi:hypothetical protein